VHPEMPMVTFACWAEAGQHKLTNAASAAACADRTFEPPPGDQRAITVWPIGRSCPPGRGQSHGGTGNCCLTTPPPPPFDISCHACGPIGTIGQELGAVVGEGGCTLVLQGSRQRRPRRLPSPWISSQHRQAVIAWPSYMRCPSRRWC